MKRWIWPLLAVAVVLTWGLWPFQRVSGEDAPRDRVWTGWVTDAASRPIRAALVVIDPPPRGVGAALVAETDREGRFRLLDPPPGRHRVLVAQINYLPVVVEEVVLDPATPPRAFVLRQTERIIEGEVRDAAGSPIEWARVDYPAEVFAPEELRGVQKHLAVRTDAKGRFRIARGLRAGAPCELSVERTGFSPARSAVDLSAGDPPRQSIRLDPLPREVLEGTVVGPDGLAVPGAHVEARNGGLVRCAMADDEGRFAIGGLEAGFVDVFILPSAIGFRAGFAPARDVRAEAPGTIRIDLGWVPENERPGAIAVSFEVPESMGRIEAIWIRGEAQPFEEIHVEGGRCSAWQGGVSPGPVHIFVRAGDWIAAQTVDVPAGETVRVTPSPRQGRFVRLHVRDGAGGPPVMGAIALPYVDAPGGAAFELPPTMADERGEVELRGLPEGCRVEVTAPGREPREVVPDRPDQEVPLEPQR
ncbi:MAG: carboxypeptidase-like regulatory domain-containing protein [Planctomycetota bacterium]